MKARILIVEDETIVQLDLMRRLEKMGHSVVGTAVRGEEAVEKANELKPDLVLMDVRLAGAMDGVEAARRIHATQDTTVIYVTAYASTIQDMTQDIVGPCLTKPFRSTELEAVIFKALSSGNLSDT